MNIYALLHFAKSLHLMERDKLIDHLIAELSLSENSVHLFLLCLLQLLLSPPFLLLLLLLARSARVAWSFRLVVGFAMLYLCLDRVCRSELVLVLHVRRALKKKCIGLWHCLLVLRWTCAVDTTVKSSYQLILVVPTDKCSRWNFSSLFFSPRRASWNVVVLLGPSLQLHAFLPVVVCFYCRVIFNERKAYSVRDLDALSHPQELAPAVELPFTTLWGKKSFYQKSADW